MMPPVVFPYQQALDRFRREGREPPLLKRMSELISLLDLTTTLNSGLSSAEILEAALLVVMGELQVSRGALLVRGEGGSYRLAAARGLPAGAPGVLPAGSGLAGVVRRGVGDEGALLEPLGFELLCPIEKAGATIALLGLGPRAGGRSYGAEELGFLRSVAACAATPIENGLIYDELRAVNRKLSVKVFQLHSLFDISRELSSAFDETAIVNLVTATAMGQLMVSRCALYLAEPGGPLRLAAERGVRGEGEPEPLEAADAQACLAALHGATPVAELPQGGVRARLLRTRMALAVPLSLGGPPGGILALGERVAGAGFSEEDSDFAFTLGRQALAALESVRLNRIRVEKQRQDRELQIAREIQQSLFPACCPAVPGFELAAESRPCQQVGGDHYDVIPLEKGRLALAIADVSGKGTPASILMASVHASLRALAGTAPPAALMARLNRFLFESTQANKYVTLFYAELDPGERRLVYVNAGHVPPYRVTRAGGRSRLLRGGTALGLLPEVDYETGELRLDPGDLLAMVTDGATEAMAPDESEFGDERVFQALAARAGDAACDALAGLRAAIDAWTAEAGCTDDLTLLLLKAL